MPPGSSCRGGAVGFVSIADLVFLSSQILVEYWISLKSLPMFDEVDFVPSPFEAVLFLFFLKSKEKNSNVYYWCKMCLRSISKNTLRCVHCVGRTLNNRVN